MRQTLRQIVAVLALGGIALSLVPNALAASYTDLSAANKLATAGIIVDQSAHPAAYRLGETLLRQEGVGTAAKALGIIPSTPVSDYTCAGKFSDISEAWVCRAAELAAKAGLTNAANTTFRPKDNLTKYEAMLFALKSSCATVTDRSVSGVAKYAADAGIIANAASFNGTAAATRGEFFRYVATAMEDSTCGDTSNEDVLCSLFPDLCVGTGTGTGTGTTTTGDVVVSAAANQPNGTIVAGQATAQLLDIKLTGTGTVKTLVLHRTGISDQNTLTNVYLYDGATRLTDGYSFNTNSDITLNNLDIAVSGSRTISVRADVASSSSTQSVAISVTNAKVDSNNLAPVDVTGNLFQIASGSTLATVGLSGGQSVAGATVNAGTSGYVVWRQAVQVNLRTLKLEAANFRIAGSAPSDALENIGLYVDGVKTGPAAELVATNGSNYISFDMTAAPVDLTTGSHTVEVRADIIRGSSYNFSVSLQQASDLMVYDPQVGVNVALSPFAASTGGTIIIGAGTFTAVQDPTFSAMTNVTGGSSNATIAKFKLHGYGEDVKVTSLTVLPVLTLPTPAFAGFQNVTLFLNGSQVGTQQNWTSGALTFNLGSQLIVPAGVDSTLEIRADLRTTTGINYTAGTVSAGITGGAAEGVSSKSTLGSIPTPSSNGLTIQTGVLSVSKNSGYANTSISPNSTAAKIGSFVLQNQSTSEGVRVTSLTVGLSGSTALTNFSGLKTSETSGSGSTPVQPQASNTFSVDFTLAPGATKTIDIFADTSSATGSNIVAALSVSALGATSNITSSAGPISGQTISLGNGTVAVPTFTANASSNAQFIAAAGGFVDGSKNIFKLTSTGGTATVSELKFTVTGGDAISSIRVGTVSAPVVGGVAYLTGLSLAVPQGGSGLSIEVNPTYSNVDNTNGVASGTTAALALAYAKYTSGGTTATICTAALGSCGTVIGVGGVVANTMTLVASKPTVTVVKPSGVVVSVGNIEAIDVTVSADAKGDLQLNSLPITVGVGGASTTVATAANSVFVTKADNSPITTTSLALAATGGSSTITFTGGYLIPAGTSQTFRVFVPVTAITAGVSGSTSLSTSLATGAAFSWTDIASGAVVAQTGTTNILGYPNTFTSTINN